MPAILAIVSEILQAVLEILGIASVLQSGTSAIENFLGIHTGGVTLQQIYDQAHLANVNTLFVSDVGTISLLDIHNQIAALSSQVAAYSPAATSVQIPTTPPSGYGGVSSSDVGSAVWSYIDANTGQNMGDLQADAALLAINMSTAQVGLPAISNPPWVGAGNWTSTSGPMRPDVNLPRANTSTILPTDATIADWINRAYPGFHAALYASGYAYVPDTAAGIAWIYDLSPSDFAAIKAAGSAGATINVPPVWPGLAKATLSTTHALSDGLIITEPMDGVILELTSVAPPIQRIHYGTVEAYGHIGALSFGNDNGDQEAFQFISFANQVYCTLHFKRAQSVVIKLRAGISGTATPWTVT